MMISSVFYIPQMLVINNQWNLIILAGIFFCLDHYNQLLERQNKFMFETKESFNKTASTNIDSKFGTTVSWIEPTENPESLINRNSQYKKIYFQFLKNNTRTKGVFDLNKEKQIQSETKSFISKSLECRKRTSQFEEKFDQQYKLSNRKRSMTGFKKLNLEIQKIGETLNQKGKLQKNLFFSQTRKGIQLQEQTMLLQYYYKDKDEFAVKNYLKNQRKNGKNSNQDLSINYLRNRNHSQKKHKRFQPNKNQFQSLMLAHDLKHFEKIKKINFIKQQKFQNECFKMAEKNYQWKRENNFHQMQQIIKLNRENLLLESISKNPTQQTIKKEQKYNRTIRFFLKFAYIQKIKRTFFEYIDTEGMEKLIVFLLQHQFNSKIKRNTLNQIIRKIIKHKIETKIEFYDLMEFIDTIDETYSMNILDLVTQKYPHYFTKNQEIIIKTNIDEIKKQINPERIPFIVRLIFQSSPQKLVLNQFLPVKAVPKILQHSGITGDDIPREKLLQFLYWNQRRPEGLNYNQFYFSFMMLGVLNNNWRNVYKLLEKIKINEFLQ